MDVEKLLTYVLPAFTGHVSPTGRTLIFINESEYSYTNPEQKSEERGTYTVSRQGEDFYIETNSKNEEIRKLKVNITFS